MDGDRLAEIEARCAVAIEGPWESGDGEGAGPNPGANKRSAPRSAPRSRSDQIGVTHAGSMVSPPPGIKSHGPGNVGHAGHLGHRGHDLHRTLHRTSGLRRGRRTARL